MNNNSFYWFERQSGFYWFPKPVRFEGWVLVASYVALLVWDFIRIDTASHSASDTLIAFAPDILIISVVFSVCVFLTSGTK